MPKPFSRTLRTLDVEDRLSARGLVAIGVLLIIWLTWLVLARISVLETTTTGRLEVDRAVHAVTAEVAGRIEETHLALGARVAAGDLLLRLTTTDLDLRKKEVTARRDAIEAELQETRETLRLRAATLQESRRAIEPVLNAARAALEKAQIEARFAAEEARRAERLHQEGQISQADLESKVSAAERLRATSDSARAEIEKLGSQARAEALREETDLAELRIEEARLEGELAERNVVLEQILHDLEKRALRAPRDGELGEVVELAPGDLVQAGEPLGTLIGGGEIQAVADFPPALAVGRVHPGQNARIRLEGFPWTEFGMLSAVVSRVASEPREAGLRVELAVNPQSAPRIPIQHGMTGTVEVEIDRVSPATLLLRSLGKVLDARSVAQTVESSSPSAL